MERKLNKEIKLSVWRRITGKQDPTPQRKFASIIVLILSFILISLGGIIFGVALNEPIIDFYSFYVLGNKPEVTVGLISIVNYPNEDPIKLSEMGDDYLFSIFPFLSELKKYDWLHFMSKAQINYPSIGESFCVINDPLCGQFDKTGSK